MSTRVSRGFTLLVLLGILAVKVKGELLALYNFSGMVSQDLDITRSTTTASPASSSAGSPE